MEKFYEEKLVKIGQKLILEEINNNYDNCYFEKTVVRDDEIYSLDWHQAGPRMVWDYENIKSKHKPVFKNSSFKEFEWRAYQPVEVVMEDCVFENSILERAQFFESRIQSCVFKNTVFSPTLSFVRDGNYYAQSSVKNSSFINCDLSNFQINEGKIQRNIFEYCQNEYLNFSETVLENDFKNMTFNLASFCNSTVKNHFENVVFVFCDLDDADFSTSTFKNCDFRSCENYKGLILPRECREEIKLTNEQKETIVFI